MAGLLSDLRDFGQGASNAAASTVSGPVDLLAMLLRKAGIPVPANAVGGSEWMAQQGLTAQPKNRTAGLLGETAGLISPIVAQAKAPQIARGLLQVGDNISAPSDIANKGQRGMALFDPGTPGSIIKQKADDLAAQMRQRGWQVNVDHSGSAAGPSSYLKAYDPHTGRTLNDLRLSDHSKGAYNSQFVANINESDFPSVLARLDELRALGKTDGLRAIEARQAEEAAKIQRRLANRLEVAKTKLASGQPLSNSESKALKVAGLVD